MYPMLLDESVTMPVIDDRHLWNDQSCVECNVHFIARVLWSLWLHHLPLWRVVSVSLQILLVGTCPLCGYILYYTILLNLH